MKSNRAIVVIVAVALAAAVLMLGSCGAASKKPVKLIYWSQGLKSTDDVGGKTKDQLTLFRYLKKYQEQNPNVTIEQIEQTWDALPSLFKAAGMAKSGPDVVGLWAGTFTTDYKEFIEPLDKYFTKEEKANYTGLDLCYVDFDPTKPLLGVPHNATVYTVYYNKKLFAQAGIDEANLPTTWDGLIEAAKKLKAKGITPFLIGEKEGYNSVWAISEFLGDLIGPEGLRKLMTGQEKFSGEAFKTAEAEWKKIFDQGLTNKDYLSTGAFDVPTRFVKQKEAMIVNGSWMQKDLENAIGAENLGAMLFPAVSASAPFGDYIVSQPGTNMVVTSFSANKAEAAKFVKFMTAADIQKEYFLETGDLPANNKVSFADYPNPITKIFTGLIANHKAVIGFDSLVPADAAQEFYRLAPLYVSGKMPIEEMAKSLDANMEKALKK
jgi:raffinose/stachyose/melibiose transport system substrate-binding protein